MQLWGCYYSLTKMNFLHKQEVAKNSDTWNLGGKKMLILQRLLFYKPPSQRSLHSSHCGVDPSETARKS